MQTLIIRTGEQDVREVPAEQLGQYLSDPGTLVWLDIEQPVADDAEVLDRVFRFHPLSIEDSLTDRPELPKVDDYGDYLTIILQAVCFDLQTKIVETAQLSLYVGRSFVVTIHHRPVPAITEVRKHFLQGTPMFVRGSDWLAHAVIDTLVDHLIPVIDAIDEDISRLQDLAVSRAPRGAMQQMTRIKNRTVQLRRLITPQLGVVNHLARGDFSHLIRTETLVYFRDVYDHMVQITNMLEGLRDLSDDVISIYLTTINNRLNEIMMALSVVGVIFLPLTLIASIFGMNFRGTFEDSGWLGFFSVLLLMLILAAIGVAWFRLRRWY